MSSFPAQYFGSATSIVNQTNVGVNTLSAQISAGGGGGGGGSNYPSDIIASSITALIGSISSINLSSINGDAYVPPSGVDPNGISTNQVASADGTSLFLQTDGVTTTVQLGADKGGYINLTSPTINLNAPSIVTNPLCDLTISSINGLPPNGASSPDPMFSTITFPNGQLNPTSGINFSTILGFNGQTTDNASDFFFISPTTLGLFGGVSTNTIQINAPSGSGAVLTINATDNSNCSLIAQNSGGNPESLSLVASNVYISSLSVSSINGATPGGGGGGGITPFVSAYTYTTPLTFNLNTGTPLFQTPSSPFILVSSHTYTASWGCQYTFEGASTTNTSLLRFNLGNFQPGDPGFIYGAPAYATSANSAKVVDQFSMTWTQGVDDTDTNLYCTTVDTQFTGDLSTTITSVDNSAVLTLIDWGVL